MNMPRIMLVIPLTTFLLFACSGSPEDKIVGKWFQYGTTDTVEFFADGTVRSISGRQDVVGKYAFLDDKSLRLDFARSNVISYDFDGGDLLIGNANGNISRFTQSEETAMAALNEIRDQVEAGVVVAEEAKEAVSKFILKAKRFGGPSNNDEAGIGSPDSFRTDIIDSVTIRQRGIILVTFGGESVATLLDGKTLTIEPSRMTGDSVEFRCTTKGISKIYVPDGCVAY